MKYLAAILVLVASAHAQLWSGIVDSSRAVDWAGVGVSGGIPARTTICQTLGTAGQISTFSQSVTAAQINTAITNCTAGQTVFLNTGTYSLNNGLTLKSNVTLRGAGANNTLLNFTASDSYYWGSYVIGMIGSYDSASDNGLPPGWGGCAGTCTKRSWTGTNGSAGTYTKGATVINLSSAPTGLQNGQLLSLTQNDDAAPISGGVGVFFCADDVAGCSRDGDGSPQASQGTGEFQNVKVVSVSGSAVTISPGIYMDNWRTGQSPIVFYQACCDIRGAGVEDLRAVTPTTTNTKEPIAMFEATDCWVKGVVVIPHNAGSGVSDRDGMKINMSRNVTIKDSVVGPMHGGGFGSVTSYGIETQASSAFLIENNILVQIETPLIYTSGDTGGVSAYNYDVVCQVSCSDVTGVEIHGVGYAMNLLEGNEFGQYWHDDFHGSIMFSTLFRNWTDGEGGQQEAITASSWARYLNIVGNVIVPPSPANYQAVAPSTCGNCWRYIPNVYRFGYPGPLETSPDGGVAYDTFTAQTIMRWGNYDNKTAAVRWCGNSSDTGWVATCASTSEVPTGLASYSNAVPGTETLPASFYYSSKPAWWPSAKAWPLNGPDVSSGNLTGTGGHANTTAAHDCYTSISGTLLNFNAATCYPLSSGLVTSGLMQGGVVIRGTAVVK